VSGAQGQGEHDGQGEQDDPCSHGEQDALAEPNVDTSRPPRPNLGRPSALSGCYPPKAGCSGGGARTSRTSRAIPRGVGAVRYLSSYRAAHAGVVPSRVTPARSPRAALPGAGVSRSVTSSPSTRTRPAVMCCWIRSSDRPAAVR
jgi:hypothetical protein